METRRPATRFRWNRIAVSRVSLLEGVTQWPSRKGGDPMRTDRTVRSVVRALVAIAFIATACGGGDERKPGTSGQDGTPVGSPAPTPERTLQAVTPQELESADIVLFTGSAPQGLDNGGFGFEEGDVSSPGPEIRVTAGAPLTLVLQNISEEFLSHDFTVVAEKDESSEPLWASQTLTITPGESTLVTFTPEAPGKYFYICSIRGHMSGHGMWGRFVVE